jgi:hypothetical protein
MMIYMMPRASDLAPLAPEDNIYVLELLIRD